MFRAIESSREVCKKGSVVKNDKTKSIGKIRKLKKYIPNLKLNLTTLRVYLKNRHTKRFRSGYALCINNPARTNVLK